MTEEKNITVLGVLEFNSIAIGIKALDEMVKTAPIRILDARTICFGKYLVVFSGDLASVEYSFNSGYQIGGNHVVDSLKLSMVHPEVIEAIGHVKQTENWNTIGIIETLTVTSGIEAADIAAKRGDVSIIEIRLANGFGGKSYVKMIGNLEDIQASMEAGVKKVKSKNLLHAETIIPQPHKEIQSFFFKEPE